MNLIPEINTALPLGMFDMGSMFFIILIAVMLFGGDLPQMARKFGKYYSEFQRSVGAFKKEVSSVVSEITSDIDDKPSRSASKSRSTSSSSSAKTTVDEDEVETTAPKFEPPKK